MLDHQNPVLFLQRGLFVAKALTQVHHRDNLSPQVNYALQIVGRVGDSGDLRHSHDFVQRSDGHTVGLAPYLETDDMEFAAHTGPNMLVQPCLSYPAFSSSGYLPQPAGQLAISRRLRPAAMPLPG